MTKALSTDTAPQATTQQSLRNLTSLCSMLTYASSNKPGLPFKQVTLKSPLQEGAGGHHFHVVGQAPCGWEAWALCMCRELQELERQQLSDIYST